MKKQKWLYVHTINGQPAQYHAGEQICYANGTRGNAGIHRVALSLKQIKEEQRLSDKWRVKRGFDVTHDYGYFRILNGILKSL